MTPVVAADALVQTWQGGLALGAVVLAALPLALLAHARLPGPVAAVEARIADAPWRCLGSGAGLLVLVVAAGLAAGSHPVVSILALAAFCAAGVLALVGLLAEARSLGGTLSGVDPRTAAWGAVALGWTVLAALPAFPVAGTAALLYVAVRGAGAALLAAAARA